MQLEHGATITPAINASTWEQGVATRLVLFQDWAAVDAGLRNVRLVGVQKSNAHVSPNGFGLVIPFEICNVRYNPVVTCHFHIEPSRVVLLAWTWRHPWRLPQITDVKSENSTRQTTR